MMNQLPGCAAPLYVSLRDAKQQSLRYPGNESDDLDPEYLYFSPYEMHRRSPSVWNLSLQDLKKSMSWVSSSASMQSPSRAPRAQRSCHTTI